MVEHLNAVIVFDRDILQACRTVALRINCAHRVFAASGLVADLVRRVRVVASSWKLER